MRVLLDHNLPKALCRRLPPHEVWTTRQRRWERLANGVLLRAAADGGFDLLLTTDRGMEHQQNLGRLPLPIVQLAGTAGNALPNLLPFVPAVLALLSAPLTPALYVVGRDGAVRRLTAPRT